MSDDLYEISGSGDPPDLLLRVHVQPGAGRTAVTGRHGDALRVKVGAPPEGGRANAALVALLATTLGIAPSRISIESGETSRAKRLRIVGLPAADLERLLELALASPGGGNARGGHGVTRHAP
ncbi:MAG TPA: DUF167 domain-containing protein [Acidimicrobiales bacterium]|nr:DUF167 domain-containing protein [Acidimicrobiales bacterium]